MSSFVRRIQRSVKRSHNKIGKGIGVHYRGRGVKLGFSSPKDKSRLARLAREEKRAARKEAR